MNWLKPYLPGYLRHAVPAWICLLGEVFVDLSLPTLMAAIVNQGILQSNQNVIRDTGLLMLGLALVGASFGLARSWFSTLCSQNLGTNIRADLFRQTQRLTLAQIRSLGTESLITRLTNDVMQVQNLSFMLTRVFIRAPMMLFGGIVMAVLLNARMALILVAVLPLLSILIGIRVKRGLPLFRKVQAAMDRTNGVLREYLAGVRVVKVFNRSDYEAERFDAANRNQTDFSIRAARSMAAIQPLIAILMNGSIVLLLWLGGQLRAAGQAEVGDIIAFINYFLMILHAMHMMSFIFTAGVRAKTSVDRIGEVFAMPDGLPVAEQPERPEPSGRIEMRDVSYVVPGQQRPILDRVRFTAQPGQTIGIIGPTGSGKSTLINLICRFFDVSDGAVLIDGADIRQMDRKELRARIGLVSQRSVLFSGTIEDNLRWGQTDASEEELWAALRTAQAADFVERLPDRLQTWLGQGGVNLSGGQKQRMCIARALVRKPEILILDDSASALDMQTDRRLREALRVDAPQRTTLIVAQRIQSVQEADLILVLEHGQIAQQGRHDELLETSALYREIYRSQIGLDVSGREAV